MIKYSIYIIHDKKKVGLDKDLDDRLGQQGYKKSDETVEIFIEGLTDLATARQIEKQLQAKLGYDAHEDGEDLVDKVIAAKKKSSNGKSFYTKAIKDVTVGFPSEKSDFNDWVDSKEEIKIESPRFGELCFCTPNEKQWLKDNAKASKFASPERATYIYLKAASEFFKNNPKECVKEQNDFVSLDSLVNAIFAWAHDRGILNGKIETQTLKLGEEFGELQKAVLKNQPEEIKDAIGDIIVVLVSIAHFNGHSVADAVKMAYDTISKRTGYTNDKGDFIKTHYDGKEIETL